MVIVNTAEMLLITIILFLDFLYGQPTYYDLAREEGATGINVVLATISIIKDTAIFHDDNSFLRRVAYAETRDGTDPDTFRDGYNGGIWQVDETILKKTQNASNPLIGFRGGILQKLIESSLSLDWSQARWQDMRTPLYSGLAASIFFEISSSSIPATEDVQGQGILWKSSGYNTDNADTVDTFIEAVAELHLKDRCYTNSCRSFSGVCIYVSPETLECVCHSGFVAHGHTCIAPVGFEQSQYTIYEGATGTVCVRMKNPEFSDKQMMYSIQSKDGTATLDDDYVEYTSFVVLPTIHEAQRSCFKVETIDNHKFNQKKYFKLELNFTAGTYPNAVTHIRETIIVLLDNDNVATAMQK